MNYVMDRIGAAAFQFMLSELFLERTTHRVTVVDSGPLLVPADFPPVNLRWPEDMDGDLWSGVILVDTLYVPADEHRGWTAQRLATHVRTRLEQEAAARETKRKQLDAHATLAAQRGQPAPMSVPANVPKSALPDYLVFTTNLSFATLGGDVDEAVDDALRSLGQPLGLRRWKVLDHVALCRMLDGAPKTRRRHLAELMPNDVLNRLVEYDVGVSARLQDVIVREITTGLEVDQFIRLSRPGNSERERLRLHTVGVDLPVIDETRTAARLIIESADARSFLREPKQTENLLLLGGPGQGKSTIAQLVTQCYRVALLDGAIGPEHPAHALAVDLRHGFAEANIPLPRFRRWPIRVDLARYVDAATNARQTSLIGHIADLVSKRAPGVTGAQVRAWLRAWPWILILDGFDEVASVEGRDTVMEQLSTFMSEVQAFGADVVIVATSRRQGYAGEFAHQGYRHYELAPLETDRAIEYGVKLAFARHGKKDEAMSQSVIERLTRAAEDRRTARLMRSPLQITIMSILLENRERVPRARYELFEAYYNAIYTRESLKLGPLGELLEKRRNDVNALHNWLGLVLQLNAERVGGLDASIPQDDLRLYAIRRLQEEGHDRHEAEQLADQLITAVTSRLVLIVPTKRVDVGFEVRSIQEFFAARAIVSGADEGVLKGLGSIIEPAHWRNTWLFAAGKVFVEREHLRHDLVGLLQRIDDQDLLHLVVAPGADLALDLLEDDVATTSPGLQRSLCRQALELLKYPPDKDLDRRCAALYQIADADPVAALLLEQAVDAAVAGGPGRFSAAYTVLRLAQRGATPLALRFRPRLRAAERAIRSEGVLVADVASAVSAAFTEVLAAAPPPPADHHLLDEFLARFHDGSTEPDPERKPRDEVGQDAVRTELLDRCLTRESIADVVAKATLAAAERDAQAGAMLRDVLRSWLQRRDGGARTLLGPGPAQGG